MKEKLKLMMLGLAPFAFILIFEIWQRLFGMWPYFVFGTPL